MGKDGLRINSDHNGTSFSLEMDDMRLEYSRNRNHLKLYLDVDVNAKMSEDHKKFIDRIINDYMEFEPTPTIRDLINSLFTKLFKKNRLNEKENEEDLVFKQAK